MNINRRFTFRITFVNSIDFAPLGEVTNTEALFTLRIQWLFINLFIQLRK